MKELHDELCWTWGVLPDDAGLFTLVEVPSEYGVRPGIVNEKAKWFAEHLPTKNVFGVYDLYLSAVLACQENKKRREDLAEKQNKKAEEFDRIVKRNSLDERYKNKVVEVEVKVKTNDELKAKYTRWNRNAKKIADAGMKLS